MYEFRVRKLGEVYVVGGYHLSPGLRALLESAGSLTRALMECRMTVVLQRP
ncbi:Uncharacterized protein FKW44_020677 [Caligus rogercresseyi]|uniref:Uncharacterized protein n=1 Tax=Caligus rogercresseyi TaxID=217165 RepID=A0A7T8GQG1_CALRO|nr:Uncharacterized protein FKW44_020677 [Caligus rogercresseyi]